VLEVINPGSTAIVMIGERALRDLVMATSVTQAFKGIPEEFVDMSSFWDNSATCGVAARLLAERCQVREGERLFVAGMLHGIGRLVLYSRQPDRYRDVLQSNPQGEAALLAAEMRVFGFSHAELGAALMQVWHMPDFFQVVIGHQMDPEGAEPYRKEAAVLQVARDMAANLAPTIKSRQPPAPWQATLALDVAALLGLDAEALEAIRIDALAQAFDVLEVINPGSTAIY
jgi:HD-like signal output (HDOD) protein